MLLCFTLSMPSNNAWNGKWTGEKNLYSRIVNIGNTKKRLEKGKRILEEGYFSYNFGDGWVARIDVKEVKAIEAAKIRKISCGFCGYDWMIESILDNLDILAPSRNS